MIYQSAFNSGTACSALGTYYNFVELELFNPISGSFDRADHRNGCKAKRPYKKASIQLFVINKQRCDLTEKLWKVACKHNSRKLVSMRFKCFSPVFTI